MNYYINIKFGISNKTYYFATDDPSIKIGDFVVVETVVGVEIGEVTTFPADISNLNYDREIKPILRLATPADMTKLRQNELYANSAKQLFEESIQKLNLDMKLIGAQYTLDRTKILFTYVADERVDFRELLKILAAQLHCRIELKQINSRERAQFIGGIGVCGLPLCCTTFFSTFDGVSLNKAKNQMLAINIPKLSGQCGKLMCCLKYEDDYYTEAKKEFPEVGTVVKYEGNEYKVQSYNIFSKVIKIANNEDAQFLSLDEINGLLGKKEFIKKKNNFDGFIKVDNAQNKNTQQSETDNQKENRFSRKDDNRRQENKNKQQRDQQRPQKEQQEQKESNKQFFAGQQNKAENYQKNYNKNNNNRHFNKNRNFRKNPQNTDKKEEKSE